MKLLELLDMCLLVFALDEMDKVVTSEYTDRSLHTTYKLFQMFLVRGSFQVPLFVRGVVFTVKYQRQSLGGGFQLFGFKGLPMQVQKGEEDGADVALG